MTAADLYFWSVSHYFPQVYIFKTRFRFASGYGNLLHLGNVNISPVDTPILCGIIASVVQCFFAYRVYTLRPSYIWICVLIVLVRSPVRFPGSPY